MFSPEQKRYIYENSVKINDQNKYVEIMAAYSDYFSKTKRNSIKKQAEFVIILLVILYVVCTMWLFTVQTIRELVFRASAIFVGTLLVYKFGKFVLDYIDDLPVVEKIKQKECDLLCYTGMLNDVSKFINYGTSTALKNYFMTVEGNKLQIDRKNYKLLSEQVGKKIKIYYFAELLQRQMFITDAVVIFVEE